MIPLPRLQSAETGEFLIKVVGLGGAGCNVLDRLHRDGQGPWELVAVNTDSQALAVSAAPVKIQAGSGVTRGLGAGGDPEMGAQAAHESVEDLRQALEGAAAVFLCVGLGGGTGSGAAPLLASLAREREALVVVFATMPFGFEGRRRQAQAEEALEALRQSADVVVCFENDRMASLVQPQSAVQEAFAAVDQTVSQSLRAVVTLLHRRGLVHAGLDELTTVLRSRDARCLFGYGEAAGDNRAHDALELALKCPLLGGGDALSQSASVLISVAGGTGLRLDEVQTLMGEFNRHVSQDTQVLFGAAVDPTMGESLSVTILSSTEIAAPLPVRSSVAAEVRRPAVPLQRTARVSTPRPASPPREEVSESEESETSVAAVGGTDLPVRSPDAVVSEAPAPRPRPDARMGRRPGTEMAGGRREARQEQMQFEPASRGRFDKSEPTIVDGEDLDVPAFLRRTPRR